MSEIKDLFFLILFLSLSIIIFYRIKKIGIKNGNCIKVKGIGEKEILLVSLSWNCVKVNNLNLFKIETFLLNMYLCFFNC